VAGVAFSFSWLWVAVAIVLQVGLVYWIGLILAALFPFAGDIDHIYQIVLRIPRR
jgi:ABC-type polysaccharide/polyol phosphate export permease